ncbi:S-layer homology domain-containing protein [Candidatus Peregrinibacteria bacterium]|jgi:hypothetical protein|nr:S-layer homology domain-containing protein [Candidatus Peregrinibacteria bacterium]MBT7736171.1 S-layer homology domain-containing protein [Candidatus Peregrinibacteria bacterium]
MAKKKTSKKVKEHSHFIAVLVLFAGFSIYSLASFFTSNTAYIDHYYASVTEVPTETVVETDYYSYFNDVADDHPHITAVTELLNAGVLEGYPDGSFRPDEPMTRAGLLKVLATAVDADFGGRDLNGCFTDVTDEWYAPFVCYAKDAGWVSGHADGSYKPGDSVTRGAALKIAMEAMDYAICDVVNTRSYDDVEETDWLAPYVCAGKRDGVTSTSLMFYPNEAMTRAEFADILFELMKQKQLI